MLLQAAGLSNRLGFRGRQACKLHKHHTTQVTTNPLSDPVPLSPLLTSNGTTNLDTMDSEDDDDVPVLSSTALAALQSFYTERDKQLEDFEQLRTNKKENISISDFKEDWNASQFWFTDDTAMFLARQLLKDITTESTIAVVSAPSVYIQLKKLLVNC